VSLRSEPVTASARAATTSETSSAPSCSLTFSACTLPSAGAQKANKTMCILPPAGAQETNKSTRILPPAGAQEANKRTRIYGAQSAPIGIRKPLLLPYWYHSTRKGILRRRACRLHEGPGLPFQLKPLLLPYWYHSTRKGILKGAGRAGFTRGLGCCSS
jgi:hypothetical protein